MNDKHVNSSDASIGQPMVSRVLARKLELETLLAGSRETPRTENDIATALSSLEGMLSGDLAKIPHVVMAGLNRWLENNKHLAETSLVAPINPDTDAGTESTDFAPTETDAPPEPARAHSAANMNEIVAMAPVLDAWSPNS